MIETLRRTRLKLVRESCPELDGLTARGPDDVRHMAAKLLDDEPAEVFVVFHLNARHDVVGFAEVTRGILDASLIHPREVFRSAILSNAASIILVHNHPSGDASPSAEDRAVTRQLSRAGKALGIPVLDHVVIGGGTGSWQSLANEIQ